MYAWHLVVTSPVSFNLEVAPRGCSFFPPQPDGPALSQGERIQHVRPCAALSPLLPGAAVHVLG